MGYLGPFPSETEDQRKGTLGLVWEWPSLFSQQTSWAQLEHNGAVDNVPPPDPRLPFLGLQA